MLSRIHRRIIPLLPLALLAAAAAIAQEDESQLQRMLEGQRFDPELLIDEAGGGEAGGRFQQDAPTAQGDYAGSKVALILPTKRAGLAGDAARALLDGFQHAAEVESDFLELAIYSTDGTPEDVLLSYDHAADSGVGLVVGPMLKGSVGELLQARKGATVTTLVTQPVDVFEFDESEIYGISIGYEAEAKMIARTAVDTGLVSGAIVVEEAGTFGRRVTESFAREWERLTNAAPRRILVATQDDYVELHESLKEVARASIESGSSYWPLVFAAGERDFVLKARAHTPGLLALHALSLANEFDRPVRDDVSVLGMDNVHMVEMPWVVAPDAVLPARYHDASARGRSLIEQRFFALGVDIYRLAAQRICWSVGCSADGVAGTWTISRGEHNFRRAGILASYVEGALTVGGS